MEAARETAELLADSSSKSLHSVAVSERVAGSLEHIAAKVRKVNELIASIATASDEQSRGVAQVSTAVNDLQNLTRSNAVRAQEAAVAAHKFRQQAAGLSTAITDLQKLAGGQKKALPSNVDEASNASTTHEAPERDGFIGSRRVDLARFAMVERQNRPAQPLTS